MCLSTMFCQLEFCQSRRSPLVCEIYVMACSGTRKRNKNKVFVSYFDCRENKKGGKKKGEGSHCSVSEHFFGVVLLCYDDFKVNAIESNERFLK